MGKEILSEVCPLSFEKIPHSPDHGEIPQNRMLLLTDIPEEQDAEDGDGETAEPA